MKEIKQKLDNFQILNNKVQDRNIKKYIEMVEGNEIKNRNKEFHEAAKTFDKIVVEEKIEESSLIGSNLPKTIKIDYISYNLDNYEGYSNDIKLITKYQVKSSDLEYILPNLFTVLKLNEQQNFEYPNAYDNNFSTNMDLYLFFIIHNKSPQFLKNDDFDLKMDQFKNFISKNITYDDVNTFSDIMMKDKFFTFVKNPESLKTVLFIAEILTENSKVFKEVSFNLYRKVCIGLNIQ